MRVRLFFEGREAALVIEPETEAEGRMLVAFGLDKQLEAEAKASLGGASIPGVYHHLSDVPKCLTVVVRQARKPGTVESIAMPEEPAS